MSTCRTEVRERRLLEGLRGGHIVATRSEPIADCARLLGPGRDDGDGRRGLCARLHGRPALRRGAFLRLLHLTRDPPVLGSDALDELVVVDDLREARRRDDEGERVGLLADVRVTHALLEHGDDPGVLALEADETPGLLLEKDRELLEPRALFRELRLEVVETRLRGIDGRLRGAQLVDDGGQLGGQHTFLLLRGFDLAAQLRNACIDALLLRPDVLTRGGRDQGERGQGEQQDQHGDEQRPPSHAH